MRRWFIKEIKVLFIVTHQEVWEEKKKDKKIDWKTVVGEYTNYKLKNAYLQSLLWIKVNALLLLCENLKS